MTIRVTAMNTKRKKVVKLSMVTRRAKSLFSSIQSELSTRATIQASDRERG